MALKSIRRDPTLVKRRNFIQRVLKTIVHVHIMLNVYGEEFYLIKHSRDTENEPNENEALEKINKELVFLSNFL